MKKVIFFLLVVLTFVNVEAQTYEQTQRKIKKELSRLDASLNEVNDKLYYLTVTLTKQLSDNDFKAKQSPSYLSKLEKEKFFAKEDTVKLKLQKAELESTIKELTEISLSSTEDRIGTDAESNIPERMRRREFEERFRSAMFKNFIGNTKKDQIVKTFSGVLRNYKTGKNELATFKITNIRFPEFPPVINVVGPDKKIFVSLPAGSYKVEISCGQFYLIKTFDVNPFITKSFDGDNVYWFSYKAMSDI